MVTFTDIVLIILFLYNVVGEENVEVSFSSNRTGRNSDSFYGSPQRALKKSDGYFRNNDAQLYDSKQSDSAVPKTPRGFMDFVSGEDNSQSRNTEEVRNSWSPYYLPPLTDYVQSGSNPEDKVWKREDEGYDQLSSNYNPDYSRMYMMMQAMKKMDSGSSRPGELTRILDNPTTLVMATFIPISLIIAASLPLIMNVMMNGITIPAIIPSQNGARTRGFMSGNTTDILGSVIESFVDFSARYVDSPDCLQKIVCNMAVKNDENAVPGSKYLKRATKLATLLVSEDILNTFGIKNLVNSIKKGTCDEVKCGKNDKNFSKFLELVKQEIHNYSYKTLPKLG